MIEEIKKEIKKTFYIDEDDMHFEKANINIDSLFEILDKYNNQPDYKSAWEELKDTTIFTESYPREHKMSEYYKDAFEELEQKYNLGTNNKEGD